MKRSTTSLLALDYHKINKKKLTNILVKECKKILFEKKARVLSNLIWLQIFLNQKNIFEKAITKKA